MTLEELQSEAQDYLIGRLSQAKFHDAILAYLEECSSDAYGRIAEWVLTETEVEQ